MTYKVNPAIVRITIVGFLSVTYFKKEKFFRSKCFEVCNTKDVEKECFLCSRKQF